MKMIAEYLENAFKFERVTAEETDPKLKANRALWPAGLSTTRSNIIQPRNFFENVPLKANPI